MTNNSFNPGQYCEVLDLPDALLERVEAIHTFYSDLISEKIEAIFITDIIKSEGERQYENLWFFSSNYCMEAKTFYGEDNFDLNVIGNNITHLSIQKDGYDFKKAKPQSRLHLEFSFASSTRIGQLKATSNNCDYLKKIIEAHIIPNLYKENFRKIKKDTN